MSQGHMITLIPAGGADSEKSVGPQSPEMGRVWGTRAQSRAQYPEQGRERVRGPDGERAMRHSAPRMVRRQGQRAQDHGG